MLFFPALVFYLCLFGVLFLGKIPLLVFVVFVFLVFIVIFVVIVVVLVIILQIILVAEAGGILGLGF